MHKLTHKQTRMIAGGNVYFGIRDKGADIKLEQINDVCLYEGFSFTLNGCYFEDKLVLNGQTINNYTVNMTPFYYGPASPHGKSQGISYTIHAI